MSEKLQPNSIATVPQAHEVASVESFINKAIEMNVPVETMEKLFALREKVKAEQAREAFTQALADFQSDCPIIAKTKKVMNKDGRTVRYVYAPIDSIVEQIKKPLAKHAFSYTWDVEQTEKSVTAIAKVTHKLGHSETSRFNVQVDTEGFMTAPQKIASALTFAKRYALCNALGISTGDEDTDATDVKKEAGARSDKAKIVFLLRTLGKRTEKKEEIEDAVKNLAKLELVDKNYDEIVGRLEVLVQEKNNESPEIR